MRIVGRKSIELSRIKPLFVRDVGEGELEELAKSIEAVGGIVEPVVVRPSKEGDAYELICGYRRFLAHKRLGLSVIEAVVVECDDKEAYQLFLIENLQRVNLSDYEVAKRLKELRDRFNLTPTQIAQLLGKSVGWVGDHLRLLELEKEVAEIVSRPSFARAKVGQVMDKLTQSHAKAILAQAEPVRKKLVEHVVEAVAKEEEPPSARALERRAKELAKPEEEKAVVEAVQAPRLTPPPTKVEVLVKPKVEERPTGVTREELRQLSQYYPPPILDYVYHDYKGPYLKDVMIALFWIIWWEILNEEQREACVKEAIRRAGECGFKPPIIG